eukprot:CAMPEP_0197657508 /NCGR_PEP_ID=MMETSP1338-20131121/44673_1 /TAXON_ID=43686 ORGANISM="Pelagodinium beii, Strain RCC1491" /NCGR_SAMPLE_ID=MMETSP1338 /ASSEMBLY_ACC=CAM_ASM_000754 /LENGTH=474 /DNA_ID=CAMNT_0043233899 /DNA_START=43 /DNA_END=1467 /DNA_ORIENTATION=-
MASQMVLRCTKTGRVFFSTAEAQEHAEAFGKEYANFDEVSLDHKVWICVETGRPCYTEQDMNRMKMRDPDAKTFEEKTVAYLGELQKKKDQAADRKEKFFKSVNLKKLDIMTSAKSHGKNRAAKALHFTKSAGTIEAAEAWLAENAGLPDLDKLTDEFVIEALGTSGDVTMTDADGDVVMAPAEDTRKPGDPNPPEIKEKVKQDLVKQIVEMGFSEMRAEKALYKTDNAGLEHAVNWLAEHAEDADIDLPLLPPPKPKPKLSKEEAEAKALELQKKLREKKAEEERLKNIEQEKERKESTKLMAEAQVKFKEEERKREIERQQREKEEHERHKAELKERLRQDYIERFGCEPPEDEEKETVKEMTSKDKVAFFLNKLKKTYKDTDKEGLKTCLATLKIYIKNLHENPLEPKFKKLKLENKAFQTRVAPFDGALELLDVLGFEKKEDCLEQRKSTPDGFLCGQAIKFIDLITGQL